MRKIRTLQVGGATMQAALDDLHHLLSKLEVHEGDVISIQRVPLEVPLRIEGAEPEKVMLWAFYWGD